MICYKAPPKLKKRKSQKKISFESSLIAGPSLSPTLALLPAALTFNSGHGCADPPPTHRVVRRCKAKSSWEVCS